MLPPPQARGSPPRSPLSTAKRRTRRKRRWRKTACADMTRKLWEARRRLTGCITSRMAREFRGPLGRGVPGEAATGVISGSSASGSGNVSEDSSCPSRREKELAVGTPTSVACSDLTPKVGRRGLTGTIVHGTGSSSGTDSRTGVHRSGRRTVAVGGRASAPSFVRESSRPRADDGHGGRQSRRPRSELGWVLALGSSKRSTASGLGASHLVRIKHKRRIVSHQLITSDTGVRRQEG